jgi:hypothetical protein
VIRLLGTQRPYMMCMEWLATPSYIYDVAWYITVMYIQSLKRVPSRL